MSSRYRLSPAAQADIEDIWDYTATAWSVEQAESYLLGLRDALARLALHPEIARERTEIRPPVRLYRHRSHLVIYRIGPSALEVIRIVHNRRDWQTFLLAE